MLFGERRKCQSIKKGLVLPVKIMKKIRSGKQVGIQDILSGKV
uniref:Uncharacterized protein n=1 Tax=Anguilla anguilla TaxID=7936 RepID=A0A0E9W8E2_ANGAN